MLEPFWTQLSPLCSQPSAPCHDSPTNPGRGRGFQFPSAVMPIHIINQRFSKTSRWPYSSLLVEVVKYSLLTWASFWKLGSIFFQCHPHKRNKRGFRLQEGKVFRHSEGDSSLQYLLLHCCRKANPHILVNSATIFCTLWEGASSNHWLWTPYLMCVCVGGRV